MGAVKKRQNILKARWLMNLLKKIFLISTTVILAVLFDYSSQANAEIIRTHTRIEYQIRDELFSSYSVFDLKDMARRMKERARSLQENARKHFNSLLPMQGKARAVIAHSKEQAAKLKDQQRLRNHINDDRLADQRQRQRELAFQRRDVNLKIRLDC